MRCFIVWIVSCFLVCEGVKAQGGEEYIISREFNDIDRVFNNEIFMVHSDCTPIDFYEVLSKDTIKLSIEADEVIPSPYLVTVSIKVKNTIATNLPDTRRKEFSDAVLTYQILLYGGWNVRLFGFYTSDIMSFVEELGRKGTKCLVEKLVEVNALSYEEGKLFYRAIIKKEKEYPTALGKPCNLLKYYFTPEEIYRANTIILPMEPLRKITF